MKRRDLIKKLEQGGFRLVRTRGDHDIYKRGNESEAVPRHREVKESLARGIIKRRGL